MPGTLTSPYSDNATTQAQNTVVGFKISKPGYDARRTAGNNYIFNSSWPSLPIAYETKVTGTGAVMAVPHNLRFPSFSMAWATGADPSGIGTVSNRIILMSDATNAYFQSTVGITYKVRCFQLDLSQDIDYQLAPGDTFNMPYDSNFGVKAVKQFKDINSTDLRDFTVHSRAQSPLILAVKTEATIPAANLNIASTNIIQYTSKLTYPVWVYGFVKAGATLAAARGVAVNTYIPAPYYSQAYPRTFTDGFKAYIGYVSSGVNTDNGATLVILRDPMFAPNLVTVQY